MIKTIAVATMMLILAATPALAQGKPSPAVQPTVLGQTGTMYDGNNAQLQMPPEQNAYWTQLWAEPGVSGKSGPVSAVGTGAAGTSLGGTTGGGEH